MSETSVTGSMNTRLAGHTPACGEIVAIEMATGTFQVTMRWRKEAPNLMDLMGECVVVVTTAAKGEIHGGCTLPWPRMR